jgi:YbbR domain-containing protein
MNWRAAVLDNWAYKIAALLVVSLLWINITAEQRQAQDVATLLEFEVTDSAWVLVDAPTEVRTTFQGRNRELLGLLLNEPVIRIAVSEVTGPTMRVPLDADLVSFDNDLGVRPTLVVPMSVELRFERMTERRVAVVVDIETVPAMGYTVLRPLLVEPDSVTVRGAASQIDRVLQVATRRVTLNELEHPVMRDLPLELPAGVEDVVLEPRSVLVTVPVDSLVVRRVRLPVEAVGEGVAGISISPDSVDAVVRGAWSSVQTQLESMRSAVVRVVEPPESERVMGVQVELVRAGFVSVTMQPAQVTIGPGRR